MSSNTNYTPWFADILKQLIDCIVNQDYNSDNYKNYYAEIKRGLDYSESNPGKIDPTIIKIGKLIYGSISAIQDTAYQPPKTFSAPPAQTFQQPQGQSFQQPQAQVFQKPASFEISELKQKLASRKKDKVEKKMRGSIDLLKDFEEG